MHSPICKQKAFEMYFRGEGSLSKIAATMGLSGRTVKSWHYRERWAARRQEMIENIRRTSAESLAATEALTQRMRIEARPEIIASSKELFILIHQKVMKKARDLENSPHNEMKVKDLKSMLKILKYLHHVGKEITGMTA